MAGIGVRVLVVDDASPTGSTREVAKQLEVSYVRLEVHDGRSNPAMAICHGVSLVDTEYYSIFGDDDIMLPRFVRLHVERLDEGFDVCTGSYQLVDGDLAPLRDQILPEPHLGDLLAGKIMINDGAMTRTELAQQMEWDPTLDQVVLYPVWLGLLSSGARTTRLTEPTWLYRRHERNISRGIDANDAAQRRSVRDRFAALLLDREGRLPEPRVVTPSVSTTTQPVPTVPAVFDPPTIVPGPTAQSTHSAARGSTLGMIDRFRRRVRHLLRRGLV